MLWKPLACIVSFASCSENKVVYIEFMQICLKTKQNSSVQFSISPRLPILDHVLHENTFEVTKGFFNAALRNSGRNILKIKSLLANISPDRKVVFHFVLMT